MNRYPNAAEGLKLIFYSQIVSIIGTLLAVIPLVGVILILVAGVMNLMGLNKAAADDDGYRTAFQLTIAAVILKLVGVFVLPNLLGQAASILSLAVLYFVCTTTARLLRSVDQHDLADRGELVWKINLVCTVVSVVCYILAYIPVLNVLAAIVAVVVAIVSLVGAILYLLFLSKSYKVL